MIRGQTLNVALNPLAARQLRDEETMYPAHLTIYNGVRTDAGFFKGRPGYDDVWDIGVDYPINLLIPKIRNVNTVGFAVTTIGTIYELYSDRTSQLLMGTALTGDYRPTWCEFDDLVIICDGQAPVQLDVGTTITALAGSPPAAKYCAVVADRVVLSGYNDTDFVWSDPGTAIVWPAANTSSVTGNGESIKFMQVAGTDIYFFKDCNIEVWSHIGGTEVFGRRLIIPVIDKFSRDRGIASYSVVQGDDAFYFYADGDFWVLAGASPQRISAAYKREIGNLLKVDLMYGFHFAKEHLIRWFEPVSGRTFVYDYVNQVFTEDYTWARGDFARMPIYSYAEFGGIPYFGDYDPTGTIYRWGDDLFDDNGTPIHLMRKLRIPFANGHKGRVNRLQLRLKRGSGGSAAATEYILVRWAFDEGTWTPYTQLAIGDDGDRDPYVDVLEPNGALTLGVGREMKLEISQAVAVPHIFTHALLTVKELGR